MVAEEKILTVFFFCKMIKFIFGLACNTISTRDFVPGGAALRHFPFKSLKLKSAETVAQSLPCLR